MKTITSKEFRYIIYATIFSFILFVLVIPNILPSINGISPIIQFIIFNIGIFFFLQIFLKSITLDRKFDLKYSIGIILLFIALDILIPPLLVETSGKLNDSVILGTSASDYIFGLLAINLGMSGFLVYLFTYIFIPFILLLISSILLKNLIKEI